MVLIPERVWNLSTDEERDHIKSVTDGWRFQPSTECPSCGVLLGFKVRITTSAVVLDTEERTPPQTAEQLAAPRLESWKSDLSDAERRVVDEAEQVGLLKAFGDAVTEEKAGQVPENISKFLLVFLKTARLDSVPRFVLDEYLDLFAPARLEFFSAQGIYAVQADGVTRAFFPKCRLSGRRLKSSVPGQMKALFQSEDRMTDWIRGRFGYVPRDAKNFSHALRQSNTGKFGAIVQ